MKPQSVDNRNGNTAAAAVRGHLDRLGRAVGPARAVSMAPAHLKPAGFAVVSGRSASKDGRFADWADAVGVECGPIPEPEKDAMIFELDAVVAHLYGLTEAHLRHIFETFHEGWDYQGRLERVMGYYHAWTARR